MHPAFARKRLETALLAAGIADDAAEARDCTAPDCLAGLAVLLGNRASNGVASGDAPASLRALLAAEGAALPPRAEAALRRAESAAA